MKSRTSSFNGTVFWKDLTRFAPVWGIYLVCLLMGTLLLVDGDLEYWFAANLAQLIPAMALVNMGYALIVAQVLFGDLFNARMCNALHALPLRRECWYGTHVVSGLLFSMAPTAIMTVLAEMLIFSGSIMVNGWQIPLYFLLGANLEYLFFFGLAVVCMFCTGNRVGAALIYGIVNFLSYMVYFLVDTVYTPMLHGVMTQADIFSLLCPVVHLITLILVDCKRVSEPLGFSSTGEQLYDTYGTFRVYPEEWAYVAVIAVLGVALLLLGTWLYRRRRLECAGDLLASKKLEPVFMVLFSLMAAAVFQLVKVALTGYDEGALIFLFAGLTVGWFAGRMLIERQVRVFRRVKNWLGFIALTLAMGASLLVNKMDPFGIEDWVPDLADVRSVQLNTDYYGHYSADDPEAIADVIRVHELALDYKLTDEDARAERASAVVIREEVAADGEVTATYYDQTDDYRKWQVIHIVYKLENGWTMQRRYNIWVDTEEGAILNGIQNRLEMIFPDQVDKNGRLDEQEVMSWAGKVNEVYVDGHALDQKYVTEESMEALFRAVIADSEAGTLAQLSNFHEGYVMEFENGYNTNYDINLRMNDRRVSFSVYIDSANCLEWLEGTDIIDILWEAYDQGYYS